MSLPLILGSKSGVAPGERKDADKRARMLFLDVGVKGGLVFEAVLVMVMMGGGGRRRRGGLGGVLAGWMWAEESTPGGGGG